MGKMKITCNMEISSEFADLPQILIWSDTMAITMAK